MSSEKRQSSGDDWNVRKEGPSSSYPTKPRKWPDASDVMATSAMNCLHQGKITSTL